MERTVRPSNTISIRDGQEEWGTMIQCDSPLYRLAWSHNGKRGHRKEEKHTEGDIEWRVEGRCYRESIRRCALDPSTTWIVDWL